MTKQEEIRDRICSKCCDQISGFGSIQAKIVNGKLMHIICPDRKNVVTKREKIREGIVKVLFPYSNANHFTGDETVQKVIEYLHSEDVVIKVGQKPPENPYCTSATKDGGDDIAFGKMVGFSRCLGILNDKYAAIEPLIKEEL